MSTKIGHFEILSELAKSATGAVYKANDPQTSQTVAVKAIQLSAFGEHAAELEKCLLEEAENTKALSHSNLRHPTEHQRSPDRYRRERNLRRQ